MTRKLEDLFDLPPSDYPDEPATATSPDTMRADIVAIDRAIDKIDAALPAVRDLDASDQELDDIAAKATETFENLTDLGFNVDSRFAAELFAVAGTMLGHALTAKTTKLQKKLKVLDLQMKKMKLDADAVKNSGEEPTQTAHGQVLSRNDLLEMIKGSRDQNNTKA
jgi:predicted transcriptional regulator